LAERDLPAITRRYAAGDHLCLLYENRDQQFTAVLPFIRDGLRNKERCLYIAVTTDDKLPKNTEIKFPTLKAELLSDNCLRQRRLRR